MESKRRFAAGRYTEVVEDNAVDIVSSSFGECELDFTAADNGGADFTGILKTLPRLVSAGQCAGHHFRGKLGR